MSLTIKRNLLKLFCTTNCNKRKSIVVSLPQLPCWSLPFWDYLLLLLCAFKNLFNHTFYKQIILSNNQITQRPSVFVYPHSCQHAETFGCSFKKVLMQLKQFGTLIRNRAGGHTFGSTNEK